LNEPKHRITKHNEPKNGGELRNKQQTKMQQ